MNCTNLMEKNNGEKRQKIWNFSCVGRVVIFDELVDQITDRTKKKMCATEIFIKLEVLSVPNLG